MKLNFAHSQRSSVGIEWELALVDADSGDLRQVAPTIIDSVMPEGAHQHPNIRQELLLNTIEVVSDVRNTVAEAGADLARAIAQVRTITDPLRVELMCAGTHPFARWAQQKVTDQERYATLIDRTQWWGRQMLIYGVHTHVGLEDRDKALPIASALITLLPHLQSLSASSPFWGGNDTGYASNRALMFQQLPTAGIPFSFQKWEDLEKYFGDMMHTGVIDSFDEIRWDVRPSPRFGTLEVRVADGASNLTDVLALSAFAHCAVEHFSRELDAGRSLPTLPPWFVQENKWRSARYGMEAIIILNDAGDEDLVTTSVLEWIKRLEPVAVDLGCLAELEDLKHTITLGASYQRQRAVAAQANGQLDQVVAHLVAEMRAGLPLNPFASIPTDPLTQPLGN